MELTLFDNPCAAALRRYLRSASTTLSLLAAGLVSINAKANVGLLEPAGVHGRWEAARERSRMAEATPEGDSTTVGTLRVTWGAADSLVNLAVERTGSVRNKYPSLVQSAGAVYSIEGGRSPARLEEGASMVLRVEAVSSLESDSASAAAAAQAIDDLLLVRLQPASTGRTLVVHEQTCYGYRDVRQPGGSMPFQRARCAPLQWELRLGELQPGEYALVPADQITAPAGPIAVYTFGIGEAGPRPSDRIPSH